jgi:hypothetical protein
VSHEVLGAVNRRDDVRGLTGNAARAARGPVDREGREGGVAGRVVHGLEAEHGDDACGA